MLLLVSMVAAPIGTATVAADHDGDDSVNHCSFSDSLVVDWILTNECEVPGIERTTYDGDPAATQTTLHGMAVSEWESQQAIQTVMYNYGEDTDTIASLEARNAIGNTYVNGSTATVADENAREAIRTYYTVRQINEIEAFEKQQAQFAHIGNITNEPDIASQFLYNPSGVGGEVEDSNYNGTWDGVDNVRYTGELVTKNITLVNGTDYEYQTAEMAFDYDGYGDGSYSVAGTVTYSIPIDAPIDDKGLRLEYGDDFVATEHNDLVHMWASDNINVMSSYYNTSHDVEDGLPGQRVGDYSEWIEQREQWENQASELTTNYATGFSQDLYDALDNGSISVEQLRGAEGMVRYMSGNASTQSGDYRMALHHTLGLQNANMSSVGTMVVHYEGATGIEWDSSDENTTREPIYTDEVNSTFEGMVFSADSPVGGFETNGTYHTDNLNGTTMIVSEDGDTTFYNGTITIEAMYGPDGNEVKSVEMSEPAYKTYDAQAFIEYLEENEDDRQTIINSGSSGGDGGINWPDWGANFGGSGVVAGLVIIVAAAVSVVLLATNVFRP